MGIFRSLWPLTRGNFEPCSHSTNTDLYNEFSINASSSLLLLQTCIMSAAVRSLRNRYRSSRALSQRCTTVIRCIIAQCNISSSTSLSVSRRNTCNHGNTMLRDSWYGVNFRKNYIKLLYWWCRCLNSEYLLHISVSVLGLMQISCNYVSVIFYTHLTSDYNWIFTQVYYIQNL